MIQRKTDQRSPILTAWLTVIVVYNGAQALQWTCIALFMHFYVSPHLQKQTLGNMSEEQVIESRLLARRTVMWSLAYIPTRVIGALFAGLTILHNRMAFWCFCVSTLLVFTVNLTGGSSIWEASIDPIGLAVLIGILRVPDAHLWQQLA